jgi:hypothetical protein
MKIKVWCDSGANIHSKREDIVDLKDWNITDEEWNDMDDTIKQEFVNGWVNQKLEIGFKEV